VPASRPSDATGIRDEGVAPSAVALAAHPAPVRESIRLALVPKGTGLRDPKPNTDVGTDVVRNGGSLQHAGLLLSRTRSARFTLWFGVACLVSSAYGWLSGIWPFGVVELVWAAWPCIGGGIAAARVVEWSGPAPV